jgi:cytidylate kinase
MTPLQIAIDGPVGAGKSDVSNRLAQELGLTHLYTGAMYRALALACLHSGISPSDQPRVIQLLATTTIDLTPGSKRGYTVLLNQEDVTEQLFTPEVSAASSDVSVISEVRKHMVALQQKMAEGKSVVMEGRDIGLRVLPNAQLKIYLTADVAERAKRRWEQLKMHGKVEDSALTFEKVLEETKARDFQDMNRAVDPLRKLPEAWELDTTHLSQDQVVAAIKQRLGERGLL